MLIFSKKKAKNHKHSTALVCPPIGSLYQTATGCLPFGSVAGNNKTRLSQTSVHEKLFNDQINNNMYTYKKICSLFGVLFLSIACTVAPPSNNKKISFLRYIQSDLDSNNVNYIYLDTDWTFNAKDYSDLEVELYKLKDSIYKTNSINSFNYTKSDKETQKWISKTKFKILDSLKSKHLPYCDSNYAMLGAPIFINEDSSLLITFINTYFFCDHKSETTLPIVYQYQQKDNLWKSIDTFTIPVFNQPPLLN